MKSKTADSWAELDREIDEVIAKLNAEQPELDLDKLLTVSEEEGKALLASLEAEPLPELDLDLELNNLDKLLAASEEVNEALLASLEAEPLIELPELDFDLPELDLELPELDLELLDCAW
ncbi:TPA: hypothetical protein MJC89_26465 [Klebsiella pneumoniae]|nr:hypothetical protein [Klebsiella pneumoniae]